MSTLRAHQATVTSVGFHTSGLWLFSGDEKGWVVWWDLLSKRPKAIWRAHDLALLAVKYLGSSELEGIVTHGRDNKLRVWRLDQDQMYNTDVLTESSLKDSYPAPWLLHSQDVNALNFCRVAVWNSPAIVAVPSTMSSEKVDVYTLKPFGRPIKGLAPPSDGEFDSETRGDGLGTVMAIDLGDKELVMGFESGHVAYYVDDSLVFFEKVHKQPVLDVKLFNGVIWTAGADRQLTRIQNGEIKIHKLETRGIKSIAIDKEATKLVTAGWDGMVRGFSTTDFSELWSFKGGRQDGVTCVDYATVTQAPNQQRRLVKLPSEWIAVGGKDGRVGLFSLDSSILKMNNLYNP